jgi:hypothetical protein
MLKNKVKLHWMSTDKDGSVVLYFIVGLRTGHVICQDSVGVYS